MKTHAMALLLTITAMTSTLAEEAEPIAQKEVPRIVLHDILTNRVCIYESKLYSLGSKVLILDEPYECINANQMTFGGSDDKWDMQWVPVRTLQKR